MLHHEIRHLGVEQSGGDGVHKNAARRQFARKHARELVDGGLAGGIRIGQLHFRGFAVDGADVNDARRVCVGGRCQQLRQQPLREHERSLHVHVVNRIPGALGKALERGAPGLAGVVDEHVQAVRLGLEAFNDGFHTLHRRQVAFQRFHRTKSRQFLAGRSEGICLAPGNPHAGAGRQESGGEHGADAARTASDEHVFSSHGEQLAEVGSVDFGHRHGHLLKGKTGSTLGQNGDGQRRRGVFSGPRREYAASQRRCHR